MEHFVEEELKTIVNRGAFGKNCTLVSFKLFNCLNGLEEWWYKKISCNILTSDESHHSIMIKLKLQDLEMRSCFGCDFLFNNELIFYEKIIPFLLDCRGPTANVEHSLFIPRFFYGRNTFSELTANDIIIIENVSTLRYCLSDANVFLDYEHLTIAIRTIAKFHGLSYTVKHVKNPSIIHDITEDVYNLQYDAGGHWMAQGEIFKKCGKRGMDRLLERDRVRYQDHERIRRLNELFDDADGTLMQTLEAREPLSVICHGDYNRNTLLFQYDDHGRPFDAVAIDYASIQYGSPALDLSSFLYMSTTRRVRELHWDDLLDTYCSALAASVLPGVRVPGRAEIDAEMAATAVNGFAKALFCVPFMLRDRSDTLDSLVTSDDPVDYFLALGGDTATDHVADMVQHFVDMGYTDVRWSNLVHNVDSEHCQSTKQLS